MVQLHKASLVEPTCHSQKMLDLLELTVSSHLVRYLARVVVDAVTYGMEHSSKSSDKVSALKDTLTFDPFFVFASNIIHRSEVRVPTILVSLVYIKRAKQYLFIRSPEWACERVFLGALILANKYVNDWSIKNYHWALCSGVFGRRDIGRIEREFLDVIDWELSVTEVAILKHYDHVSTFPSKPRPVPAPAPPSAPNDVEMDAYPWTASDNSPLSSVSPTPSPKTPSTAASPSSQLARVHLHSDDKSQVDVTVKPVADPEPKQLGMQSRNSSHVIRLLSDG